MRSKAPGINASSGNGVLQAALDDTTRALGASELRYRRLFESAKDGILILDAVTGMVVDVNPFLVNLLGYSHDQFLGKAIWELGFLRDIAANAEKFAELCDKEYVRYENLPLETSHGRRIEVEFVSNVYLVKGARVIQCNIRDITARRRSAEALRESERFAQATIDALPGHLCVLDESGTILAVNQAWRQFAAANQALPHNVCEGANYLTACAQATSADGATFAAGIRAVMRGEQAEYSAEYPCHSPAAQRWFLGRVTRFTSTGPTRVVVEHENITARKLSELQLREQNDILANSHEGVVIVNLDHQVAQWSRGAAELFGWTAAEALGQPAVNVLGLADAAAVAALRAAVERDGFWHGELRSHTRDGRLLTIDCRTTLVRDEAGRPRARVNYLTDITEKKLLDEKFLRTQRLEAVGTLSSGLAHDLNNILAPLLMIVPLLRPQLADPKDVRLLTMIEQAVRRGADIIKQLLMFSRGSSGPRSVVPTGRLLTEIGTVIRETFPRDISLRENVPDDLCPIMADATQIHQVLLNLCVNARDAMPAGGTLTLGAVNVILGPRDIAQEPLAKPGSFVRITVTDTGDGISRENLDRIFEPFFTTKKPGQGTGLGLSTVLGIVRSHGGLIAVSSEPGRGTQFTLHLPAVGRSALADRRDPPAPQRGSQQLILVVDDEEAVRMTFCLALERANYRVLSAPDGLEAVKLFLAHRPAVQLVLTDLMMPGMDGVALVRTVRGLEPHLPIVAASGLQDPARRRELAALGVADIIAKPCTMDEMLTAVHHALTTKV